MSRQRLVEREAEVAHVGAPLAVDDHLVGVMGRDTREVGVQLHAVGINTKQLPASADLTAWS